MNALQNIGNTPLIRLTQIEDVFNLPFELYGKVELYNPSGSIKDRAAKAIILGALARGEIQDGAEIVEATSGNMGISLAMIASSMHLGCKIYMPVSASMEREQMMKQYGAEVIRVDGGMKECSEKAQNYCKTHVNSYFCDQFNNLDCVLAHYQTGQEIMDCLGQTPDYFIAGIGTGGTISGCATILKKRGSVKIIGVEPEASPLLTKGIASPHKIQGIGANFVPSILKRELIDEVIDVSDEQAYYYTRTLKHVAGLFVGITSGAALAALLQMKEEIKAGSKVVLILPDDGNRYLSVEGLYD